MWRLLEVLAQLSARYGLLRALRMLAQLRGSTVMVPGLGLMPVEKGAVHHLVDSVEKLRRLAGYVQPGDLVFDLGAHVGLFSVLAARAGARVVAVEPSPGLLALLERNTAVLDVVVEPVAVGASSGEADFWVSTVASQTSGFERSAVEVFGPAEPIRVPVATLADLIGRYGEPDVLKVDVQGSESTILSGSMAPRVLLVELSILDPKMTALVARLQEHFSSWEVVNDVYGGADVAFFS